jgi:hypothetical protein
MDDPQREVVDLCRTAADKLGSSANLTKTVLFPGWDYTKIPAEEIALCETIRSVARAIVGEESPDSGTTVPTKHLAELIRYVADMLEE